MLATGIKVTGETLEVKRPVTEIMCVCVSELKQVQMSQGQTEV